jgi:hypothetical protein
VAAEFFVDGDVENDQHCFDHVFWGFLIGATAVSLVGNIAHAVLPYIPRIFIQIGGAAVPPIALAVRAGASGTVYRWAVSAVAAIGVGAFAVSFLALRDLMRVIGYSSATAWIFPAIIDTAVAVSTMMLVALGDKPARRTRTASTLASTQTPTMQRLGQPPTESAKAQVAPSAPTSARARISASVQPHPAQTVHDSAQTEATQVDAEIAQVDADLASELIASGVTAQPVETVVAVLAASRDGASINAAAKASGINYRTARRIVAAAAEHRQRQLVAVG